MNYLTTRNGVVEIEDSTASVKDYVDYEPSTTPKVRDWISFPITPIWVEDELQPFRLQGARDVLKEIGPISKEDYDYYENL